ncbi:MAG: putative bifunctional diguanylate cyclase/phosphodiesterase [Janthinobacterium lividum]
MLIEGRFLQSRVARRFFISVFLLVAFILFSVGALFYQLGNQLVHRATVAVLDESTRAVGRNLFDSLTGAARLLGSVDDRGMHQGEDFLALNDHQQQVFASIRVFVPDAPTASSPVTPRLVSEPAARPDDLPQLFIIVPAEAGRPALKGTLKSEYVWERAESGLYSLCFQVDATSKSYCQSTVEADKDAMSVSREILFRPFLDAAPWQLKATASSELTKLLPMSLGLVAAGVSALAFCIAIVASSVYLRRWASSLNRFMRVTRQASSGNFSDRVPVQDLRDELRDLAESFNAMMENLQTNFEFNAVLSRMDLSVLERAPLERVVQHVLTYARTMITGSRPTLVCRLQRVQRTYHLNEQGGLTFVESETDGVAPTAPELSVEVGEIFGGTATLTLAHEDEVENKGDTTLLSRLEDLGRRLAIAAEAVQHEATLIAQANTDSLTGLLNRHGFLAKLTDLIRTPIRGASFDVVFVDLDGFKEVNDAFGHFVGDEVLRQFGQRLQSVLHMENFDLARLGGDEFALLLPVDAAGEVAHELQVDLQRPFQIESREITLAFSMGSATFPTDGQTVADLLRQSDLAMYEAKSSSGSILVRFIPGMDAAATERLSLLRELRLALESDSLHVVYQPRISSATHCVVSVEALMRWKHPVLGSISPVKFIPLAEESGLIVPFGFWILEQSCKQYKAWEAASLGVAHISVNVSPVQMMAPTFFEEAIAVLGRYDIPAGGIELEITEGAMVQNIDATSARIRELQRAGFHIALDDFGVGYSALSYLRQIPFDTLKIDQSFVKHIHDSQVSLAIASAIIILAKTLGKRVVAEGVEVEDQARTLKELGADELQGYLFGRPMESSAVTELARGFSIK